MKYFLREHIVVSVIGLALVVSGAGAIWYISSSHTPSFNTTVATRGDVVAALDEPATVLAEDNAMLSFQESGQIAHVYVTEGQSVAAGTVLADLSSDSLQAGLAQASAAVAAAEANLAQVASGTRPEQLALDETVVTNAQSAISADIGNAYTSADDAVHNQTDNLFTDPKSNNPIFLVPVNDSQMLNNIENNRLSIESILDNWYIALNATSSVESSSLTTTADTALSQLQSYLDLLALAVNDATTNSTMTPTVLAGYKANVVTARTEVGAAITTLTNAESVLATAQNTLVLAQAGSTPQAIEAAQAAVAQALAAQSAAQVALNNTSLVAPFSGIVQDLTAQIGQVVTPGVPVVSLVNNGGLKIQVYASETDVARIKDNDEVQITLDAFGTGMPFPATVASIDSAQTQVNGTPSYLVTLYFTNPEPQIKDGMTGNAHIILAEDDNVIEVPDRIVINNGDQYFVLIATATGTEEVPVSIGLAGDDGMTEIKSGITEGEPLTNF